MNLPSESELISTVGACSPTLRVSPYLRSPKHIVERVVAAVMLLGFSPLILSLMVLIRLTSKGSPLFAQVRVGKNGRYFKIYKLRTMRHDAEAKSGAAFSTGNDPRVTALGRFLRKTHLDELPQLYNVVAGHMSFVGPRPERPEFIMVLSQGIEHYVDRLQVLPGITGLAAINLPPDDGLTSAKRKQILDVEYISTATFSMDIRMMLATALRLIGVSGEKAMTLMSIKRVVELDEVDERKCELTTPDAIVSQIGSDHQEAGAGAVRVAAHVEFSDFHNIAGGLDMDDDNSAIILDERESKAGDSRIGSVM